MNSPNETGIVYLRDLPKDKIYVDLNKNFKLNILIKAKNISGSWINLGKNLNLKISKGSKCKPLESIKGNKRFKIEILLKIIDFLKDNNIIIKEETICNNIEILSTRHNKGPNRLTNAIYKPKLPMNFNTKEGGILIAAFLGDGGIDKEFKPHYNNNEIILKRKVYESFCSVFGSISGKAREYNNQQIYFPKVSGIILTKCLWMKHGRKTETNPNVPKFILNGTMEVKSSFLQHIYDDEGTVYFNKKDSQREIVIKFANLVTGKLTHRTRIMETNDARYAPSLIKDIKYLIEGLGIKTTKLECVEIYKTNDGVYNTKWTFHIRSKSNFQLFISKVNFHLERKKNKLLEAYNSFHDFEKSKTQRIAKIIDKCEKIETYHGFIASRLLAKECDRSYVWAKKVVKKLRDENKLITRTSRQGREGAKYILTR